MSLNQPRSKKIGCRVYLQLHCMHHRTATFSTSCNVSLPITYTSSTIADRSIDRIQFYYFTLSLNPYHRSYIFGRLSSKSNQIIMLFKKLIFFLTCLVGVTFASHRYETAAADGSGTTGCEGTVVVKKDERQVLVSTEFGQISAVNVTDGIGGHYHLQFITLEPNALFLPVVLHADMVFYVHTGNGSLSWLEVEVDTTNNVDLQTGDVYRLPAGSIFYFQSSLEAERTKLRIYAMFVNPNEAPFQLQEPILPMGTYSSIRDLLLGFDRKVLQAAFQASDEAMEELMSGERLPQIVHAALAKGQEEKEKKKKKGGKNIESRFMEVLMGSSSSSNRMMLNLNEEILNKKKKKKTDTFNFRSADHDFENCNGWSVAVTNKNMRSLRDPDIGLFMVNLIRGAMMGPHWNPLATEVGIVVHGPGMVITVSNVGKSCRFKVDEGDVFVVPRFGMMAQLAFNNESFVFMGFSSSSSVNHPQYAAGKASVLQVLDREVLSLSFNVTNSTMDQILNPAVESIILECASCAEEEERIMYEEIRKEDAARKREEEEEARKREEEEARKREEEEEARKREEEEARKREEEEEEARKREEEEEEARKREEEEEARKREEEEARKREEEEARKREEEEARKREEEEARKREEEEEEARKREEEEEEARKREEEEEEARKREEEEEEEMTRREEEEARRKREEEEARKRKEEEEEAAKREEEEAWKKEEEQEEAARRRQKEEEEARKREEQPEEEEPKPEQKE